MNLWERTRDWVNNTDNHDQIRQGLRLIRRTTLILLAGVGLIHSLFHGTFTLWLTFGIMLIVVLLCSFTVITSKMPTKAQMLTSLYALPGIFVNEWAIINLSLYLQVAGYALGGLITAGLLRLWFRYRPGLA